MNAFKGIILIDIVIIVLMFYELIFNIVPYKHFTNAIFESFNAQKLEWNHVE